MSAVRVFGTFPVRRFELAGDGGALTGVVTDATGDAIGGQLVTLSDGRRTISTHTDERGRYRLRSPAISAGRWMVSVGDERQTLVVDPSGGRRTVDVTRPVVMRGSRR